MNKLLPASGPSRWLALIAGAAGASSATHQPIYMPNTQNVGNPASSRPRVLRTGRAPVAGEPAPVNMAYFGGHVQVTPKIYLVFWGWGEKGAFDHTTAGMPANDPDGAAARMTAFIRAMGGTRVGGRLDAVLRDRQRRERLHPEPDERLGGVWYDDTNPIHNNVSGLELAQEAQRAVAHFGDHGSRELRRS